MFITNNLNLPSALVEAVSTDRHNKDGQYSATTLLKGTCETILMKRHWDEIKTDASENIWQIFGTAVHSIFEKQKDNSFKEEFFSVDVSNSKVTGRVDSYDMENETIVDWKTASVWKVQFKDFSDWKRQGLIYAWLLKKNGLNVKKCRFIALLKDHSKSKARFDASYPQSPVFVFEFDVTEKDLEEIEKFIFNKVADFEKAEKIPDEELPACSKEERWATEGKWKAKKEGRKTALKVCDTEEEAKECIKDIAGGYVEYVEGCSRKCEDYCVCKDYCPFYKSMIEKKNVEIK